MSTHNKSLVMSLTLIATLGGLLFGYDTAVISGAISAIDANFINPRQLDETARLSLSGFTIASALWGCVLGGLVAGWIGDRFGRRRGLMLAALAFLISSVGSAWPELALGLFTSAGPDALWAFNLFRIIGGVGIGIASMLSPLYIAEISPPAERGRMVTYQQLAIVGGIVLVYFVNWLIAAQGDEAYLHSTGWRWMFASEAIPSALFFVLLFFVPESPRWLVMKNRDAEAHAVLRRLTSDAEASVVIKEIGNSLTVQSGKLFAFGGTVVLVGLMLSIFQQTVGINAVLYYAPQMFQNMGASANAALWQTVIIGVANAVFTLVAMFTVDRWGRKPLLILGAGIMAISMLALGALFHANQLGWLSLIMVIVYIAGFALSWGPIVWVMLAEMFPNAIKGRAMSLAVAVQWIANLIVSWSFKLLDGSTALNDVFHHGFAYYVYGGMSVLAAVFVYYYVPETKGRSLEQIQELWQPKNAADKTAAAAASV
ncbi:D-xylose transporter XylE [Permianibacter fluminis]|uniref:D-xylose transporter XylE n=1 Tax=Permianibacter fluminis TaxID=2738515 RepID=UPI001554D1D4|nr:D-xylose transporter XylE [Permianibacter fluminis]